MIGIEQYIKIYVHAERRLFSIVPMGSKVWI